MHTLKTAVGVFLGVLAALLAYDAITEYRMRNPQVMQQLGLKSDIVGVRWHGPRSASVVEERLPADLRRMQGLAGATGGNQVGTIEWTGQPETRRVIPRAPAENLRGDR